MPAFQRLLGEHGFFGRVVDKTPCLGGVERGVEIMAYIEECRVRGYPIDAFVILDDDDDMGFLRPWLVQTSNTLGLTDDDVDIALAKLAEQPQDQTPSMLSSPAEPFEVPRKDD